MIKLIITQLLLRFETFQNAVRGIFVAKTSYTFPRVGNYITALWGKE